MIISKKTSVKLSMLIFLLLFSCNSTLLAQSSKKLEIHHLTENFYVFTTYKDLNGVRFPSNSMYLVTNEGVVLFDTPWDTTQFQPLLDSISVRHDKKVRLVISTHYHDDRTAGLEFFKKNDAFTFSSLKTYQLCTEYNECRAEYYFEEDTSFFFGGYQIETYYPGKGHTQDNIVLWIDDLKILYGGCLVKSTDAKDLGNIANSNLKEWKNSIKNLIRKYPTPEYIIPGHFGWESKNSLNHTIQLLNKYE